MSTSCAYGIASVNFCQLSVQLRGLSTSVNIPCCQETFRNIPLTLRAPGDLLSTSINILCSQETFRILLLIFHVAGMPSVTFYQLSVQPGDCTSYSAAILCGREIFRKLPSTFRATGRPSVNFH